MNKAITALRVLCIHVCATEIRLFRYAIFVIVVSSWRGRATRGRADQQGDVSICYKQFLLLYYIMKWKIYKLRFFFRPNCTSSTDDWTGCSGRSKQRPTIASTIAVATTRGTTFQTAKRGITLLG